MPKLEIIPVIDILNSNAVHAMKGERSKYKNLKSDLFNSTNPKIIIEELNKQFNFSKFYIADLDSILNNKPNFDLLKQITSIQGIKIILDPGIEDEEDIKNFLNYNNHRLIFGLETIQDFNIISAGIEILGVEKLIVSIDMYEERIFSKNKKFNKKKVKPFIHKIENLGVQEIILLDLKRVGQKLGGIPKLYNAIKRIFSGKIYVGGGIRDLDDIRLYRRRGFSGVLIGTALYDGTIKIDDIRTF
ncbi:MAG: hypothetical protein KGD63_12510 [Candidatus Lokiarchaeota archaeon]|nr:hypothetical protein [Candidatus Lokiarchaeota archaeon]